MIREFQKSDIPQLLELITSNTPKYFTVEEKDEYEEYLRTMIEDYFVVEENNKIIAAGGVNYFKEKGFARLAWAMVDNQWHGRGIGSQLTKYRVGVAKNHPGTKVVDVRTTQLTNQFYEKMGFQTIEKQQDYWSPGFDLYHMEYIG